MKQGRKRKKAIKFDFAYDHGKLVQVSTNSIEINHFLKVILLTRTYNTWINYAYDLRLLFKIIGKSINRVDRGDCLRFIEQQDREGRTSTTINRRLAAVSSLFQEINLLNPDRFPQNPVSPIKRRSQTYYRSKSLYRRQPQRIPDIIPVVDLIKFFSSLPTWRDRTLVLLMCVSCLRISEALAIRFQDIECGRRSIFIPVTKNHDSRTVFMDVFTFEALNRYLDLERRKLFPKVENVFIGFKGISRGKALSVNAFQQLVRYYARKCDLPYLHSHLFRHVGITSLVKRKMSEPAIRKFVGHRNPKSLEPYLHLDTSFIEEEFERCQDAFTLPYVIRQQLTGGKL